jgi:hypothetical protein
VSGNVQWSFVKTGREIVAIFYLRSRFQLMGTGDFSPAALRGLSRFPASQSDGRRQGLSGVDFDIWFDSDASQSDFANGLIGFTSGIAMPRMARSFSGMVISQNLLCASSPQEFRQPSDINFGEFPARSREVVLTAAGSSRRRMIAAPCKSTSASESSMWKAADGWD